MFAEGFDVLPHVIIIAILGDTFAGMIQQLLFVGSHIVQLVETGAFNLVIRQRAFDGSFADFFCVVQDGWQHDVRINALQLRRGPACAIEFRLRDLERAGIVGHRFLGDPGTQRIELLHRAFAVRGEITHDECAIIILQRPRKNLRCRRAVAARQDDKRPVILHARIAVFIHKDAVLRVFHLHHRAVFDEQSRELHTFFERPAAVAPQIKDDALHVFLFELGEQFRDIGGCVMRRGFFGGGKVSLARAVQIHGHVERRKINHADAVRLAQSGGNINDLRFCRLIIQLDLIADQLHLAPVHRAV